MHPLKPCHLLAMYWRNEVCSRGQSCIVSSGKSPHFISGASCSVSTQEVHALNSIKVSSLRLCPFQVTEKTCFLSPVECMCFLGMEPRAISRASFPAGWIQGLTNIAWTSRTISDGRSQAATCPNTHTSSQAVPIAQSSDDAIWAPGMCSITKGWSCVTSQGSWVTCDIGHCMGSQVICGITEPRLWVMLQGPWLHVTSHGVPDNV